MKRTLLAVYVIILGMGSHAQTTLSGLVTDEKNEPLLGANVVLAGTVIGGYTNPQGRFELTGIPAGSYTLKVTFIGYKPYTREINMQDQQDLIVHMVPEVILADEVLVAGTRAGPEVPVTYSNLAGREIADRNLGQDMPYLIRMLPSVVVTSDAGTGIGYTGIRVRGTDLSRINVTINGIPLNDSESHGVWWVDLPDLASSVEDIQLQRGVGTSTNGAGAFGATMNLQTFPLEENPYAEINSSAGSFNTFKHTLRFGTGLLSDRFVFDGRISGITSDGYIDRASASLYSMAFNGAYYGPNKDIFRLIMMTGTEKTYQAWDGVPGDMLAINRRYNGMGAYTDDNGQIHYYDNETDNYRQSHVQLFYSKELNRSVRVNTALYYTHGEGYYEQYKEDQLLSDYLLDDVILQNDTIRQTDLIRRKWLYNDLYGTVFNLNMKMNRLKMDIGGGWNMYNGDHLGRVIWARYFSNGEKGHEWYNNTGFKTDGNVYAKTSIRMGIPWYAYVDMQIRHIYYDMKGPDDDLRDITQTHHYLFLNPKAGIKYISPTGKSAIYGSVGIAHREPSRYNFKDASPSGPVPRPERLTDYEVGAETRLGPANLSVNGYFMDYKDQLVYTGQINDVGVPVMVNVPESYRLGIECVGGVQFLTSLSWQFNLTLSENKIRNFTEYIDDWDTWTQRSYDLGTTDISFSPGIIGKSNLSWNPFPHTTVQWSSGYVGRQYIDNASDISRSLDPYWLNDLGIHVDLKVKYARFLRLYMTINNILNKMYESNAWVYPYYEQNDLKLLTGYYPQAGRNYMVGLSIGL